MASSVRGVIPKQTTKPAARVLSRLSGRLVGMCDHRLDPP